MRKRSTIALLALVAGCGHKVDRVDSVKPDSAVVSAAPVTSAPGTAVPAEKSPSPPTAAAETRTAEKRTVGTLPPPTVLRSPTQSGEDSVRGIVSVNGTERDKHTMIAPLGGGRHVEITGPLAVMIGHTAGTDVSVSGVMSGTSLAASHFIVRTVEGSPAMDGTLKIENGVTWLVSATGTRVRLTNPPPAFASRDGARVWITGDPARGVASYGFIDPPR
jgi:hypothetical protein